jgi:hypothetical protein
VVPDDNGDAPLLLFFFEQHRWGGANEKPGKG